MRRYLIVRIGLFLLFGLMLPAFLQAGEISCVGDVCCGRNEAGVRVFTNSAVDIPEGQMNRIPAVQTSRGAGNPRGRRVATEPLSERRDQKAEELKNIEIRMKDLDLRERQAQQWYSTSRSDSARLSWGHQIERLQREKEKLADEEREVRRR